IPLPGPNRMDILLVVDDSPMMGAQRDRVRAHTAGLAEVLRTLPGGIPDIHLGVVSTTVATNAPDGCAGSGLLQTNGATVTGSFVSDRPFEGERQTNYTGDLADVVETMADLGSGGCANPKPFEATKRALANTVENAGFFRADAYLYVIYLVSGPESSSGTPAQFAAELKALKPDPNQVLVSALFATEAPARFSELVAAFPNRSSTSTLDAPAPSDAFALLAQLLKIPLGDPCWSSPLADLDPVAPGLQPECTAQLHTATDDFPMKGCAPGLTTLCYSIVEDRQNCPGSGLRITLAHTDNYRYAGNTAVIECLVEATP
ncbi:MAG: hypothetical protein ABI175_23020, partial [Polyangiales bacterium]